MTPDKFLEKAIECEKPSVFLDSMKLLVFVILGLTITNLCIFHIVTICSIGVDSFPLPLTMLIIPAFPLGIGLWWGCLGNLIEILEMGESGNSLFATTQVATLLFWILLSCSASFVSSFLIFAFVIGVFGTIALSDWYLWK